MASRAAWKNSTIIRAAARKARRPVARSVPSAPDQKRDGGHRQRQPQISERSERQVFHVAERQRVGAGMLRERRRNIAGRGNVAHQQPRSR